MLATSRAERLALDMSPDRARQALQRDLDDAKRRLTAIDARLGGVAREHRNLPWHRRGRRYELEHLTESWQARRVRAEHEAERLTRNLAASPVTARHRLSRAADPVARVDRWPERPRDMGLER